MSKLLPGITKLIAENSKSQIFTCNIGIPYEGKDRFTPPIPFPMNVYINEEPGDWGERLDTGDTYYSLLRVFSLKPISVLAPITPIAKIVTFGFLDVNFTLLYNLKTYRIISQKHINNQYYVMKAELSL
jgi:hypothetical protein